MMSRFFQCCLLLLCAWGVDCILVINGLRNECATMAGDLLIGGITGIRQAESNAWCGDTVTNVGVQVVEVFQWTLAEINDDPDLLPNISLGYVLLDSCGTTTSAVAAAMYFVPDEETLPPHAVNTTCEEGFQHFQVAAVVGAFPSSRNIMTSPMMGTAGIPIIAPTASSDELSDKSRYEYFLRVSPPDRFQTTAILDILHHFNWTYFSLIFSEGNYGENGAKNIQKGAETRGLCIASSNMVYSGADSALFGSIVDSIYVVADSRAVVLFMDQPDLKSFFSALPMDLYNYFIWIGSDTFGMSHYGAAANGGFAFHFFSEDYPAFDDYYLGLTPLQNYDNPWFNPLWEQLYDCEWAPTNTGMTDCDIYSNHSSPPGETIRRAYVYKTRDCIYALALGLHVLIRAECPGAFQEQSILPECVTGERYLKYIKNVTFEGITGHIQFDENGDALGYYVIRQYSASSESPGSIVGIWDQKDGQLVIYSEVIDWSLYSIPQANEDYHDVYIIPESLCSKPCKARQYYIQKELSCCWDCRYCRNNEVVINNGTDCAQCPANEWPDLESATMCLPLVPVYVRWSDSLGVVLIAANTLGLSLATIVAGLFIRYRHEKLVKASSRELISIILVGIFMAFSVVYVILARPTNASCSATAVGFILSVSVIYAPLLVKTSRVYRIFSAGRKGKKTTAFISSFSQLVLVLGIIALQCVVTIVLEVWMPARAKKRMPVATENYVELYCELSLTGLVAGLSYNLALLLICAVLGFMTRKLPENFNESWYIFISVSTTVFMWLVFLPTYFTSFYAYYQAVLLATCLILNAVITLFCLFIPKIYAITYISDDKMDCATKPNAVGSTVTNIEC